MALTPDFTASVTSGAPDLSVVFTDTTIDPVDYWEWDFGDGSPVSTDQNPTHVYSELGTFTVSLTVYSGIDQATETKIDYITVDLDPLFAAYPLSGPINTNVNFVNGTIGDIDSWEWDFGDGSPISTDKNPSHVYEVPGKYTVSLVATKGSESRIKTKSEYITINIQADFTGSPLEIQAGTPVTFVDASDYQADTWTWNFGDGSPISHEQNPVHTYNTSGTFTVSLSITKGSVSDIESKSNYVSVGLLTDFSATPLEATVNDGVIFTDLSVGGPISWDWDFGDGSPHSYLQNPVHSYASPGYYTVELRITTGSEIGAIIKEHYIHVTYEDSGTGFVREQGPTLIFD
jgi:PKD repeat protein